MFGRVLFYLDVNTIYGIWYIGLIEKEFRYTVERFSAQLFKMNNILKIIFYGRIP